MQEEEWRSLFEREKQITTARWYSYLLGKVSPIYELVWLPNHSAHTLSKWGGYKTWNPLFLNYNICRYIHIDLNTWKGC